MVGNVKEKQCRKTRTYVQEPVTNMVLRRRVLESLCLPRIRDSTKMENYMVSVRLDVTIYVHLNQT